MLKIYILKNCSSCQKAIQFLENKHIAFDRISITETPPSLLELNKMLAFLKADGDSFKKLFNISGEQYRILKISQKIADGLTEQESLELLTTNAKLIKRPFVLASSFGLVGFKQEIWQKHF
jgi:arsenate reductase